MRRKARRSLRARGALVLLVLTAIPLTGADAVADSIWDRPGMEPYRLPVARKWLNRRNITRPHHDHPAWDLNLPSGTRADAAQAGRVVAVLRSGACGTGVVIDGFDGFRYTYCHGTKALVSAGRRVHSGDPVMRTGNSGSSTTPHLHFEIETQRRLRLKCPQPLLLSWWKGGQMTPRRAPFSGCTN